MTRTAVFTVSLSEPHTLTGTVNYATNEKSAKKGLDYTHVTGSVTFAPGETTKSVSVPVLAKSDRKLNFQLKLSGAKNITLYRANMGVATIEPDAGVVALVDAAKTAATAYATATSATATAKTALDTAWSEWDTAYNAFNNADSELVAAQADLAANENNVLACNQALQNCILLAATNSAYTPLIAVAQANLNAANNGKNTAQTRVTTATTARAAALGTKDAKYAAYTASETAYNTAKAQEATAKTSAETTKAAAAAAFVGSTKLEM